MSEDSRVKELSGYIRDLLEEDDNVWEAYGALDPKATADMFDIPDEDSEEHIGTAAGLEVIARTKEGRLARQAFESAPDELRGSDAEAKFLDVFYTARKVAIVEALELLIEVVRKEG